MRNEIIIVGILIIIVVAFMPLIRRTQPKHDCVILLGSGARQVSPDDLIEMLEEAQETFIALFARSSEAEWNSMSATLSNICKDLREYSSTIGASPGFQESASEWAASKAWIPENKEVNQSLFCILKNSQLLKLIIQDSGRIPADALDMRWFAIVRDIHRETGEIAQVPAIPIVESRLTPDYVEPKRKRNIRERSFGNTDYEYGCLERDAADSGVSDLRTIERPAQKPRPFSAAQHALKKPAYMTMSSRSEICDDRLELDNQPRSFGKWRPHDTLIDRTDLEAVRTRMRGKKDLTKKKTLAHDYDYLDDPEFNYE